jgi:hypothetical protein
MHDIKFIISQARKAHYSMTLSWEDSGNRILPSSAFFDYQKKMQGYKADFDNAVSEFIRNYDAYLKAAKSALGQLYDPAEYPAEVELPRLFLFDTVVTPIPEGKDFRADVSDEATKRIQSEIEERMENQFQKANKELWHRLFEVTNHLADKLKADDPDFKTASIDNVLSLTELLPKLNMSNDPELEERRRELVNLLSQKKPSEFRKDLLKDEDLRKDTSDKVNDILEKMSNQVT